MHNIRYHIVNTSAVIIFSFITALTISQIIRLSISPAYSVSSSRDSISSQAEQKKTFDGYKAILDSGFFRIASESDNTGRNGESSVTEYGQVSEMELLGTISGPAVISRALIKKRGEKDSKIFKLWSDVYGYKLVRIDNLKVYLKKDNSTEVLDMYKKEENGARGASSSGSETTSKNTQTISKAEIQQKILNNIDNALQGLRAGPYRVGGNIEGYKLFRVSPSNILYKLGARSGDIAKRINGHPIDSTEKLLSLWQTVQGESKITVDIERGGKLQTFEFNLTD